MNPLAQLDERLMSWFESIAWRSEMRFGWDNFDLARAMNAFGWLSFAGDLAWRAFLTDSGRAATPVVLVGSLAIFGCILGCIRSDAVIRKNAIRCRTRPGLMRRMRGQYILRTALAVILLAVLFSNYPSGLADEILEGGACAEFISGFYLFCCDPMPPNWRLPRRRKRHRFRPVWLPA